MTRDKEYRRCSRFPKSITEDTDFDKDEWIIYDEVGADVEEEDD